MKKSSAPVATPKPKTGEVKLNTAASDSRGIFISAVLDMSWQLAIVVLVPILVGVELDKALKAGDAYTFIGLGSAVIGSIVVMWRTMQKANRLPVPKLTAAEKHAIKKAYEEEDTDE